jgi:hypothetical protein
LGAVVVAVTGRLIGFQRLEQVVKPTGEVVGQHAVMVRALFAIELRCDRFGVCCSDVGQRPICNRSI